MARRDEYRWLRSVSHYTRDAHVIGKYHILFLVSRELSMTIIPRYRTPIPFHPNGMRVPLFAYYCNYTYRWYGCDEGVRTVRGGEQSHYCVFYTANGAPREGAFADVRLCTYVRAVCVLCVGEKRGRPRALIPPTAGASAFSCKRQFARPMIDYHRAPARPGDPRQVAVAG